MMHTGFIVGFNPEEYVIGENQTFLSITVQVMGGYVNSNVTFNVTVLTGSTAVEGQDFILLNNSFNLGPEVSEASIVVEIIDDLLIEGRETFTVELLSCCEEYDDIVLLLPYLATVTIEDNGKYHLLAYLLNVTHIIVHMSVSYLILVSHNLRTPQTKIAFQAGQAFKWLMKDVSIDLVLSCNV